MSKRPDTNKTRAQRPKPRARREPQYDVLIVGAGPAGSTLAWELARQGVKPLVIDRSFFPREKVCGDYVEPRGLRLLDKMGCLASLEQDSPLPITYSATFVNSVCHYRGKIPFYGLRDDLPPHGYIIPRARLDHALLETAAAAGAIVHQETGATSVSVTKAGAVVEAQRGDRHITYKAKLVVGADGVNSVVARGVGLLVADPRHTAVSQRAYAESVDGDVGEAAFYFDDDFFPGYGWMFPMSGGVVNLGVGILSETAQRFSVNIPQLFAAFVEKLKLTHHRCARLRLMRPPIGGIVKTYGGAGPNYFDGGLLIGDAGSFVDPMTGEGITPAMESALIAAPVIKQALATGEFDSKSLSAYETAFRSYFDPSMVFLDLCAATMRNKLMGESWLKAMVRGCQVAQRDSQFARTAGASFGGLEINSPGILSQIWINMLADLAALGPSSVGALLTNQPSPLFSAIAGIAGWHINLWKSILADPIWHASWSMDLQRKWLYFLSVVGGVGTDPRARGLI